MEPFNFRHRISQKKFINLNPINRQNKKFAQDDIMETYD